MNRQVISLDAIDFNNPDGEFTFRGKNYLLKEYLDSYFVRDKEYKGLEFIFEFLFLCFIYPDQEKVLRRFIYPDPDQEEVLRLDVQQSLENYYDRIYRCVQYKEALFSFGENDNKYYSIEDNKWIYLRYINCTPYYKTITLEEVFEKPYESFIEQASILYNQELPLIKNEDIFHFIIDQENQEIKFTCGSQLELDKLTKLAASILLELQPLFEQSSSLIVIYESDNKHHSGGVEPEIMTEDGDEVTLSTTAEQLFNLIYEYNFFTGLHWEYRGEFSAYQGYQPAPYTIEVEVQAPSQHERLEALLELRNLLESKLPEDEIEFYFK